MSDDRVRPFAGAPIALWVGVLLSLHLRATWLRLGGAAIPLPIPVPATAAGPAPRIAEERVGHGLRCVEAESGRLPYARCCEAGPCGRMSSTRRLLLGAPLELAFATTEDLEALPGIGPKLAARIFSVRAQLASGTSPRLKSVRALAQIRGVGARRANELAGVLGLDERVVHDICSLGSWPTTSSGCGKQP